MIEYLNIIWIVTGILLALLELTTMSFVLLFLGISAILVGILISLFPGHLSFNLQLITFVIFSILGVILFRKKAGVFLKGGIHRSTYSSAPEDDGIGETAIVWDEIIPNNKLGKIEWRGTIWNADAIEQLPKNTEVIVVKRDNLTISVQKKK